MVKINLNSVFALSAEYNNIRSDSTSQLHGDMKNSAEFRKMNDHPFIILINDPELQPD